MGILWILNFDFILLNSLKYGSIGVTKRLFLFIWTKNDPYNLQTGTER